jgi:predicted ATPase
MPSSYESPENTPADIPIQAMRGAPLAPIELVGRDRDISTVLALIGAGRLLTLTGPGGVGKTRVAEVVASALGTSFSDGVVFIPCAGIRDASLVLSSIAQSLQLRESGAASPFEAIVSAFRGRTVLLVLDNLEQVAEAAGDISYLLAACPGIKVLATSRTPLRIAGEHEYSVLPLPIPTIEQLHPADLTEVPSVALFCERAREGQPAFALDQDNAEAVAAICTRLDGLPLALELAAARLKIFSPQTLLEHLDKRLETLPSGRRDAPPRQRSLRDTNAWSYDLLTPSEQRLFRHLAVFAGGCTLKTAATVWHTANDADLSVPDGIEHLMDHNLVRRELETATEPRFHMLETIREFATEELERSPDAMWVRDAHVHLFLDLAEQANYQMETLQRHTWLDLLEMERDNLRSAISHLVATENLDLEMRFGGALARFWIFHGHWDEGGNILDDTVTRALARRMEPARSPELDQMLGSASCWAGAMAWVRGNPDQATHHLERSVTLAQETGDRSTLAYAHEYLGLTALYRSDYSAARSWFETSASEFRELGNRWYLADALALIGDAIAHEEIDHAEALYRESLEIFTELGDPGAALPLISLGRLALQRGDHAEARRLVTRGVALRRSEGSQLRLAIALASLGEVERYAGIIEPARRLYQEALTLGRTLGSKSTVAWALSGLGHLAAADHQAIQAHAYFLEGLLVARSIGQHLRVASCLVGLAAIAETRGEVERAWTLLGTIDGIRAATGRTLEPADLREFERVQHALSQIGQDDRYRLAWRLGREQSPEQAVTFALEDARAAREWAYLTS